MRHPATRGGYTRATGGARFPLAFAMRDDDVSKYYATLSRTEAVRAIASSASPVLALAFAFVFVAGVWLGRWTVLFETRARRRHLEETVDKIVAGVVAGTSGKMEGDSGTGGKMKGDGGTSSRPSGRARLEA